MRLHLFFKAKEVSSINEVLKELGEQDNLAQLVNFFEQMLKQHPSVMPGVRRAPEILVAIMRRIHCIYDEQKENSTSLNAIYGEEKQFSKTFWRKYPSYNEMQAYLALLKRVITPADDILLEVNETEDKENLRPAVFDL